MRTRVPLIKLNGADVELGNFIFGCTATQGSALQASRAVLAQVGGVRADGPRRYFGGRGTFRTADNPQDQGRRFLESNGGCIYIDLGHLELAQPEVCSAYDHVAARHAMLRIARSALKRANACQPEGHEIKLIVSNCDTHAHCWGSHLNFLMRRDTWQQVMRGRTPCLGLLASHQVSSILFTGTGKIGSGNGRPWCNFQISQRADFIESLVSVDTTQRRPLVNTRDEALCGDAQSRKSALSCEAARLHCIFFDSALSHAAILLGVGTMQIVLAMLEAGYLSTDVLLDDPLRALTEWSRDPSLRHECRLVSGKSVTAAQHQEMIVEHARRFLAEEDCCSAIPRAGEILRLWEDTVSRLLHRDFEQLYGRIDWILKLDLLENFREEHGGLDWASADMLYLDQIYGSVDLDEGLFWSYEREGLIETFVSEREIDRFVANPPEDTRAWTRAQLLRLVEPDEVVLVNWDYLTLYPLGLRQPRTPVTILLDDPRRFGRGDVDARLEQATDLSQALALLEGYLERPGAYRVRPTIH